MINRPLASGSMSEALCLKKKKKILKKKSPLSNGQSPPCTHSLKTTMVFRELYTNVVSLGDLDLKAQN